jgi:hypothetical protein
MLDWLSQVWAWHPPVGVFIGILGLISVLVPWLRLNQSAKEKAIWTALMFLLLLLEFKSIAQDRSEQNQEQATSRAELLANFQGIASRIEKSNGANRKQFTQTLRRVDAAINATTGGSGFIYFTATLFGGSPQELDFIAENPSPVPIYEVSAQIQDLVRNLRLNTEGKTYQTSAELIQDRIKIFPNLGSFAPRSSLMLTNVHTSIGTEADQRFLITFLSGRNGNWYEDLYLHRRDQGILRAYRVYRSKVSGSPPHVVNKTLLKHVDPDYPLETLEANWDTK